MVIIALINPLVSFNGIVVQLLVDFGAHSSLCSSLDSLDFVRRARNILTRAHLVIKSLRNLDAEWIDVRRRVVRVPMTHHAVVDVLVSLTGESEQIQSRHIESSKVFLCYSINLRNVTLSGILIVRPHLWPLASVTWQR